MKFEEEESGELCSALLWLVMEVFVTPLVERERKGECSFGGIYNLREMKLNCCVVTGELESCCNKFI